METLIDETARMRVGKNRYFYLLTPLILLGLSGCSLFKGSTDALTRVEYAESETRFIVCKNLTTAFTCGGSLCNNGNTVYTLTMRDSVWKEFESALLKDRSTAPIATLVENKAKSDSLLVNATLTYEVGDSEYQGSAENYDAFGVRLSQYFDEVISQRAYSSTSDDFSILEPENLCNTNNER